MAMGSIPVILADGYVPPLHWLLDWRTFSVLLPESRTGEIESILAGYSNDCINRMSKKAYEVWNAYFSPSSMHKVFRIEMSRLIRS